MNFPMGPTTFPNMREEPPILEMTIEGDFITPPQPPRPPLGTRVLIWTAAVAAVAISLAVAVFALWLLAFLIPVALIAALIAYGVFRYQLWRNGGSIQGGTIRWVRRR